MEREICEMKDSSIVVIVFMVCLSVLGLFWLVADSANQHGIKNRELIQLCIENDKRPVVSEYGRLESCE